MTRFLAMVCSTIPAYPKCSKPDWVKSWYAKYCDLGEGSS